MDKANEIVEYAKDTGSPTNKAAVNALATIVGAWIGGLEGSACGAAFGTLFNELIPSRKQKAVETCLKLLQERLTLINSKVREDYVKSDQFGYLFEKTIGKVSTEYREEKIRCYANILANSLVVEAEPSIEERYLTWMDQLTELHISILSSLRSDSLNEARFLESNLPGSISVQRAIMVLTGHMEESLLKSCAYDLDRLGITSNLTERLNTSDGEIGKHSLQIFLTKYGGGFLRYISDPILD